MFFTSSVAVKEQIAQETPAMDQGLFRRIQDSLAKNHKILEESMSKSDAKVFLKPS
jgi:hypothetical protein